MRKYTSSESTKRNIVEAAGELAAEMGIDNVSTRAVADASGENIGSIHYHFGGKDGLFEAVVRDAMDGCMGLDFSEVVDALTPDATPEELSRAIRVAVAGEINDIFRSDSPAWHPQVIYQLLQRDNVLCDIFTKEVLDPSMEAMRRFFKILDPDMGDEDIFLRIVVMKMPIYAHANYRKAMLKRLNATEYSEEYLQKLEDILVRQTQVDLGLPQV